MKHPADVFPLAYFWFQVIYVKLVNYMPIFWGGGVTMRSLGTSNTHYSTRYHTKNIRWYHFWQLRGAKHRENFFSRYQNFQSGTTFYLIWSTFPLNRPTLKKGDLASATTSLNLASSWILLLHFGNHVANKHDLVPVSSGSVTVPLPLVLVSPMYVPGTTDQVSRYHNPVASI